MQERISFKRPSLALLGKSGSARRDFTKAHEVSLALLKRLFSYREVAYFPDSYDWHRDCFFDAPGERYEGASVHKVGQELPLMEEGALAEM